MKIDVITIAKAVKECDPQLSPCDDSFKAACALLAVAGGSTNQRRIAKAFAINSSKLAQWFYNWRKNKIVVGRELHHGGWDDKESGGVAFWLDVSCGMGLLSRR